jgi:hypothetical protein
LTVHGRRGATAKCGEIPRQRLYYGPRCSWPEFICSEDNHHIMVGPETYFRSVDGLLMPTRKDQPPPPLRDFDPPAK